MSPNFSSERDVEHYLKRLFEDVQEFRDIRSDVAIDSGRADLVVYKNNEPYIIIEVKKQNVDPFDVDVVNQAAHYATLSGSNYFASTNGRKFILFETFRAGVPLMQRRLKVFDVSEELASKVLREVTIGVKWLPIDDLFVARLNILHETLLPSMLESLKNRISSHVFFKDFEEWMKELGFPYETKQEKERTQEIIAKQATYLLINKIIFYKILETHYPRLPKLRYTSSVSNLATILKRQFEEVLKIDYKAVFEQGRFDNIPISSDVSETLSKFIKELESYDFAQIKSDVIGRIYEKLIPINERKALGQYYTPPQIVELILKLTVKDPNSKILDPACGSGGFLVKAYHHLLELKQKEEASSEKEHHDILNQITGVEINQFPAHLSVINLEMQNIKYKSDVINVIVSDFFDVSNFGFNRDHKLAHLDKTERKSGTYKFFDAAVTNPPYIRQEQIKQKQKIQQLMNHYGVKLDKTSDIYSYFFVHASNFLRQNGRLGFITSNKWLEVKYGESLQKFFLDNHKILAIVEFDAATFEEALVNTCVTILEKEKDLTKRDNNIVKFIRVKKSIDIDNLIKIIQTSNNIEDKNLRLVSIRQKDLRTNTKWSLYLRAPPIYHKIIKSDKITTLDKVAEINRGITTGINEFFCLDKENINAWGIEKKYLVPAIFTPKDLKSLMLKSENLEKYVLYVKESKEKIKGSNVLEYLKHGEESGFNKRPTVKSRKLWYFIGDRKPAPIIFPYLIWRNVVFVWNKAKAFCTDVFHEIYPKKEEDTLVLLGILNSSIISLFCEIHGRSYGGGVLKVQTFETQKLPILNPSKLSKEEKAKIEKAFLELVENQNESNQEKLDKIIFDILGLNENERKSVYSAIKDARKIREKRIYKEVLVE